MEQRERVAEAANRLGRATHALEDTAQEAGIRTGVIPLSEASRAGGLGEQRKRKAKSERAKGLTPEQERAVTGVLQEWAANNPSDDRMPLSRLTTVEGLRGISKRSLYQLCETGRMEPPEESQLWVRLRSVPLAEGEREARPDPA